MKRIKKLLNNLTDPTLLDRMSVKSKIVIAGKIINGRMVIKHEGIEYPLIHSNLDAINCYMHSKDKMYLLGLATESELARYYGSKA